MSCRRRRQPPGPAVDASCGHLLHEERVPATTLVHVVNHLGRRPAAQDFGKQPCDTSGVEARQLDGVGGRQPRGLGEEWSQRVAPGEVVAAICAHEQQRDVPRCSHRVRQQVPGGRIRPMQVLHDHHDRALLAQLLHQLEEGALHPPG